MGLFDSIRSLFGRPGKQAPLPIDLSTLTMEELAICETARLSGEDGLLLKKWGGQLLQPFRYEGRYGYPEGNAIAVCLSEDDARSLVLDHQKKFKEAGKFLYVSSFGGDEYILTLTGETNDPFEVMRWAGTNGCNYDLETDDIIARYKEWDNRFGIIPFLIEGDCCECMIVNREIDYAALAEEVYAFCPDVVDQGTESVEALASEMREKGTIFLWWD